MVDVVEAAVGLEERAEEGGVLDVALHELHRRVPRQVAPHTPTEIVDRHHAHPLAQGAAVRPLVDGQGG